MNIALAHVDTWIFDLDNTLYSASTHLFGQIDERMKTFISKEFNISREEAHGLQKRYYWEHGTTLRGLMLNHHVDPDAFLDFVHDIDRTVLAPDLRLNAALARLPGRKYIYTNGTARHATEVIAHLGVSTLFDGIFDIRAGNYIPKPDPAPYRIILERFGIDPARAAMFEDSFKNLKPAADLGMATVFVRHEEHVPRPDDDLSHCAYVTDDLTQWLTDMLEARG